MASITLPRLDHQPLRATPWRMTRCECAEVSFEEVARHMREHHCDLEKARLAKGCAQTCSACLPDLRHYCQS